MGKRWAVGIFMFSILASARASTSTLRIKSHEQVRLQDEAHEFYNAWRDQNAEKIWQLSSPFLKKYIRKEEYIANIDLFFRHMTDFGFRNLKVVYMSKKLAVTQADIYITFQGEGNFNGCERMIWLRFPEGWRFQEPNFICSYMPDEKRIEFLTKNIPDP